MVDPRAVSITVTSWDQSYHRSISPGTSAEKR